jgi:hypothetical protein
VSQASTNVHLFVEILNRYLFYLEAGNEKITIKYIQVSRELCLPSSPLWLILSQAILLLHACLPWHMVAKASTQNRGHLRRDTFSQILPVCICVCWEVG